MSFEGYSLEELFAIMRLTKNETIRVNLHAYVVAKAHSVEEADADNLLAYQNLLGFMYCHGEGIESNRAMGEFYYTMAAQGHFSVALSNYYSTFFRNFYKGENLSIFEELSPFKCLEKAVEVGQVIASYHMAELLTIPLCNGYAQNHHLKVDTKKKEFYALYVNYLEKEQFEMDKGKGKFKASESLLKHKDPIALYRYAAENGCLVAQHRLYELLMLGIGSEINIAEALFWGHKAADNGWIETQNALATYYYDGNDFIDNNYELALKYAYNVAKRGGAHGQFIMGNLYNLGLAIPENTVKARKWYERAAKQNHPGQ